MSTGKSKIKYFEFSAKETIVGKDLLSVPSCFLFFFNSKNPPKTAVPQLFAFLKVVQPGEI